MLVSWTTYTAGVTGATIKAERCQHCGLVYYYEMLRVASGSGTAIYNIDGGGAEDRASRAAKQALAHALHNGSDPVVCPQCNQLQPEFAPYFKEGNLPVPGMPPALLWEEQLDAAGQSLGGRFVTGRAQKIEVNGDSIVLQLPRIEIPNACCLCGGAPDRPLKIPSQGSKQGLQVNLRVCDACSAKLKNFGYLLIVLAWLMAIAVASLVYLVLGDETNRAPRLGLSGACLGAVGLILSFTLPARLIRVYWYELLDRNRLIVKLRFKSRTYLQMIADAATLSANSGQVFPESTAAMTAAADLNQITE